MCCWLRRGRRWVGSLVFVCRGLERRSLSLSLFRRRGFAVAGGRGSVGGRGGWGRSGVCGACVRGRCDWGMGSGIGHDISCYLCAGCDCLRSLILDSVTASCVVGLRCGCGCDHGLCRDLSCSLLVVYRCLHLILGLEISSWVVVHLDCNCSRISHLRGFCAASSRRHRLCAFYSTVVVRRFGTSLCRTWTLLVHLVAREGFAMKH